MDIVLDRRLNTPFEAKIFVLEDNFICDIYSARQALQNELLHKCVTQFFMYKLRSNIIKVPTVDLNTLFIQAVLKMYCVFITCGL